MSTHLTANPIQRERIAALFVNYPYRQYQDRLTYVDRKTLGQFHSENFLKEPHGITLTRKEWQTSDPEASTLTDSDEVLGLSSVKKFSLLSSLLQKQAYLLKDFLVAKSMIEVADHAETVGAGYHMEEQIYKALWTKMVKTLQNQSEMPDFVAARLPTENLAAINALLQSGFYYVANEAMYMLVLEQPGKIPDVLVADLASTDEMYLAEPRISFRLAHAGDAAALMKLVKKAPFPTRYRLDKRFAPELVSQIYQETLYQSLQLPNHYIGVCEIKVGRKQQLMGFVSFIINEHISEIFDTGWGSLDYIAIDPDYRQNGLATLLNAWAIQFLACSGVSMIQVKTLAQNYPSSALLTRSGFKLRANNVLLHRMT